MGELKLQFDDIIISKIILWNLIFNKFQTAVFKHIFQLYGIAGFLNKMYSNVAKVD